MKHIQRLLVYGFCVSIMQGILFYPVFYKGVEIAMPGWGRFVDDEIVFFSVVFGLCNFIPGIFSSLIRKRAVWWSMLGLTFVLVAIFIGGLTNGFPEFYPGLVASCAGMAVKYPLEKFLSRFMKEEFR